MDRSQQVAKRADHRTAFTLIEILIVVAIIALLLAIAIPSWVKTRERSQRDICIENLLQIETAKQLWALETGGGADPNRPDEADLVGTSLYLKAMPACPAGGEYFINPIGDPAECDVDGHILDQ